MTYLTNCNVKISELTYVLKEETKLLKTGRISGIEEIVERKKTLMVELEKLVTQIDKRDNFIYIAPQIESLKRLARENGIILKSVLNGLRSARERLKSLQNQEAKVGAYDRDGVELFLSEPQIFSEKRV